MPYVRLSREGPLSRSTDHCLTTFHLSKKKQETNLNYASAMLLSCTEDSRPQPFNQVATSRYYSNLTKDFCESGVLIASIAPPLLEKTIFSRINEEGVI